MSAYSPDTAAYSPQIAIDASTRHALQQLAGFEELSARHAEVLFARIAWSRIAEPGDRAAGELIAALGVVAALQLLTTGATSAYVLSTAVAAGLDWTPREARTALGRWVPRLDYDATLGDITRGIEAKLRVITPEDAAWPGPLHDLGSHMPSLLWLRGDPRHLAGPALSVVGARAATSYGTQITAEIVDGVCAAGLTIVSGAAYGVDAVAHRTALAAEVPTVAVLAGGVDRVYPQAHEALLGRISSAGTVCAEMIPGSAPTRWRFLMRNRIIAALSAATLVTEAGTRSGTLNTAGHAAELGRALGAVPGPVTSAASAGCHMLIRDYGAALITNARQACELVGVTDHLEMFADSASNESDTRQPSVHGRVIDALPLRGVRAVSEVARHAGLTLGETQRTLAELELLQAVVRHDRLGAAEPQWGLARRQ